MWQLLIIFYFIFGSANYLLRRVLAQKFGEYNRLINAIFFPLFLLPATIVLYFFFPHNLHVGTLNVVLLVGGSLIWPLNNILAFHANRKVDVGIFTIINNLSPLFTLVIALPLLHESMKGPQLIGAALLIVSGILAASSQGTIRTLTTSRGILICLASAAVLGVAIAYERFMLSRVDFGAYLVYGWGAQIVWALWLARHELKKLPWLFQKAVGARRTVLWWGGTSVFKSITFILALKTSTASIISVASNFLSVAVVIAAYVFLREREHMGYKLGPSPSA